MKLSNVFCLGCFSLPRIGDLQASTKGPIFFLPVSKTLKTNITILLPNSESTRGLFCAAQNWLFLFSALLISEFLWKKHMNWVGFSIITKIENQK